MTELSEEHWISGQEQGDDVSFHDWRRVGLPHACLRLRRVALSVVEGCEVTEMGMVERRMRRRWRGGLVILWWRVVVLQRE